ncbi:DUF2851 family protein [Pontixanthobacter gangjinensis]|uniref:DUF2851 family protein n=1 Tax=Christiangramia aestuarii TaxID=1028746 RepID=A0A7M3SXS0_9FLAO|nr:DUF2851 family protein [Christiangramia aestuarii]
MREDLLYHLWKFQKFDTEALQTSAGEPVSVIHPGFQNELAGPDFFNSRIQIGDQLWAGNVEIHVRASDWYFHQHETDPNYENVILHVVWEDDSEIYRNDNSIIPTLSLKDRVSPEMLANYSRLLEQIHLKLNCENDFPHFSEFQVEHWLERLYFERLEAKSARILKVLCETGNDWEATLFIMLARSFGSNVNAEAFMSLAQDLDFKIIQKLGNNLFTLEALLLGHAGLIKETDNYGVALKNEYQYLKHKYSLQNEFLPQPQFFKLRPDNFPSLRLAQMAALYSQKKLLFQDLMQVQQLEEIYRIFNVQISDYWKTHYNFGKSHPSRIKKLTRSFIGLLVINCILPMQYCYRQQLGKETETSVQSLLKGLKAEKNTAISIFYEIRPGLASSAMHSQALLHLKQHYCSQNKCLQCELGASLLRKSPKYV